MRSQVEKFLKELSENEEFRRKFEKASIEEKDRLASFYLDGMSLEEFKEEMNEVKQKKSESLRGQDLENVAGGGEFGRSVGKWLGSGFKKVFGKKGKDSSYKKIGGEIGDKTGDLICRIFKY